MTPVWHTKGTPGRFGWWPGPMAAEFHQNGTVTLLRPLVWVDPDGTVWSVPAGFTFDGASIPRVFWPVFGHPLSGRLVRAACVHDWHCVHQDVPATEAHRRFYHGLRADGVRVVPARAMYATVIAANPRWTVNHAAAAAFPPHTRDPLLTP